MTLRCFLFASDEATSDVIRQVLTALGVEGETCPIATTAVEKVANEPLQLVIIDWELQPEAGMVLNAARERKAADRPLTIAIVSDDASGPKALQAGANSILRKPLAVAQVTDTLKTARDLLRSKFESPKRVQAAVGLAGSTSSLRTSMEGGEEKALRAGEFLQSAPANLSGQIITDAEVPTSPDQSVADDVVDPLKDLETVAAAAPPPLPEPDEPKGLEWYLKKNGINRGGAAAAPAPAPVPGQAELLGYDQTPSHSAHGVSASQTSEPSPKNEPALFSSYIDEQPADTPKKASSSKFNFRKGPIIAAMALAAIAVSAAPQAPWHPQMKILWARGQRSLHAWLNPPATTAVTQAPTAHEDFGRAGDEYKLPVPENIPDATTDPSQIQVVPAVDPTKKPTTDGTTPDQTQQPQVQVPTDGTQAPAPDGAQPSTIPAQQTPSVQPAPPASSPTATPAPTITAPITSPAASVASAVPAATTQTHSEPPTVPAPSVSSTPVPSRPQPTTYNPPTTKVPSSLQSQMAVMTPEASGNKPADAAMPAIEPVNVPELTERSLLTDQPAIMYPASARGQQGTVILQVLIGRDGTVQDAKFLQGSLAFARTAIEGVKLWKFKPYTMNGRPVSVATLLTVKFKPGQ